MTFTMMRVRLFEIRLYKLQSTFVSHIVPAHHLITHRPKPKSYDTPPCTPPLVFIAPDHPPPLLNMRHSLTTTIARPRVRALRISARRIRTIPSPQPAPVHLDETAMHERMNTVNQNNGSKTPRMRFARWEAKRGNRVEERYS